MGVKHQQVYLKTPPSLSVENFPLITSDTIIPTDGNIELKFTEKSDGSILKFMHTWISLIRRFNKLDIQTRRRYLCYYRRTRFNHD